MSACTRIRPLLDVYLDDAATPETNALVHEHLSHCRSCAAELQSLRGLRAAMRQALGEERASTELHQRVRASLAGDAGSWRAALHKWIVPASAAALVVFGLLRWQAREPAAVESAVAEHVACALQGRLPFEVARYQPAYLMPWLPHAAGEVRILDAHACGREREYQHVVVEGDDSKASILITTRDNGNPATGSSHRHTGEFDVSVVRSPRHVAYLVIDQGASPALHAWRAPAIARVERFLKQLEGL